MAEDGGDGLERFAVMYRSATSGSPSADAGLRPRVACCAPSARATREAHAASLPDAGTRRARSARASRPRRVRGPQLGRCVRRATRRRATGRPRALLRGASSDGDATRSAARSPIRARIRKVGGTPYAEHHGRIARRRHPIDRARRLGAVAARAMKLPLGDACAQALGSLSARRRPPRFVLRALWRSPLEALRARARHAPRGVLATRKIRQVDLGNGPRLAAAIIL